MQSLMGAKEIDSFWKTFSGPPFYSSWAVAETGPTNQSYFFAFHTPVSKGRGQSLRTCAVLFIYFLTALFS